MVRYVQVAHNRRVEGTTQAQVLVNLGREDRLDLDGLRRLVGSINRYLREPDAAAGDVVEVAGGGLSVVESRPAGTAWLLDRLWRQVGVDQALAKVLGRRRFTTDVERVLFALVANRAIDPMSKLATAEWASHDVALPGVDALDEDQAYRAMDLLVAADAQAEVQEAVFFAIADLWASRSTCWFSPGDPEPALVALFEILAQHRGQQLRRLRDLGRQVAAIQYPQAGVAIRGQLSDERFPGRRVVPVTDRLAARSVAVVTHEHRPQLAASSGSAATSS